jgi:hypothetical protein
MRRRRARTGVKLAIENLRHEMSGHRLEVIVCGVAPRWIGHGETSLAGRADVSAAKAPVGETIAGREAVTERRTRCHQLNSPPQTVNHSGSSQLKEKAHVPRSWAQQEPLQSTQECSRQS